MDQEFSVEVGGKSYTMEDLELGNVEDRDTYLAVLNGIERQENEAAAPLYKEVVRLYNEEAKAAGYVSYREYAYEEIYSRDYSEEDVRNLEAYTKEYLAPLFDEAQYVLYDEEPEGASPFDGKSAEEILDDIEPWIEKTVPELTEAWDYLRRNSLLECESGPGRAQGGFTIALPEFHAGYIYIDAYGGYWDYKTVIHEFGHFNAGYHEPIPGIYRLDTMDVAEVQSQGLEVLFTPYWGQMAGNEDLGDYYARTVLLDMVGSVVTGCMYNECEEYAFSHLDESIEEWNRAFGKIYGEYGFDYYTDGGIAYEWVTVGHFFEMPLYYISYATSAVAALEIYADAEEDRDAAVEKYLAVSAAGNMTFSEMLSECGLADAFDRNTVRGIAADLADAFDLDGTFLFEDEEEETEYPEEELPEEAIPEEEAEPEESAETPGIQAPEEEGEGSASVIPGENGGPYAPGDPSKADAAMAMTIGFIAAGIFFLVYLLIILIMVLILEHKRKNRFKDGR